MGRNGTERVRYVACKMRNSKGEGRVATKSDFTEEQWQVLQWAVAGAMTLVSMSDKGFWDTFKEAGGAAKVVAAAKTGSDSELVRDLASDLKIGRDKEATANPADMASGVSERIGEAVALVAEKAPEDLAAFKALITAIAEATAEAADGVAPTETDALDKIKAALG